MTPSWPGAPALALVSALAATSPSDAAEGPRLSGTVVGPAGQSATIELGDRQFGVSPGDDVAGWVVTSIAPGQVMLHGPDGPVRLSIAAAAPMPADSPPPPPYWVNSCGRRHGVADRRDAAGCRAALAASGASAGQDSLGKFPGRR